MASHLVNEPEMKCRLIDWLVRRYKSSLISMEVPVIAGKRWIDVMLITSKDDLIAFEIKSDYDSLYRLNGQIKDYLKVYDKINVVSTIKYYDQLKTTLPDFVGIIIYDPIKGIFHTKRRPKYNILQCKKSLAQFIWKNELCSSISDNKKSDIVLRKEFVINNDLKAIRKKAINSLRSRYTYRFDLFMKEKSPLTQYDELEFLTKKNYLSF